jgi:hypothetical protein
MKKLLLYSLLVFFSLTISVATTFAQNPPAPAAPQVPAQQPAQGAGQSATQPVTIYRGPDYVNVTPFSTFGAVSINSIINNAITYISSVLAILAVASIMYGGVLYMTAGGDSGRLGKAKQVIILTFVGLVLASLAYVIVIAVTRIFYSS